jgi:eukaryotic-like serine/threonine-protein kinase
VPLVTDLALAAAERKLHRAGFAVQVIRERKGRRPGTVLAQSPAAGAHVRRGTRVALTVAGPRPPRNHLVPVPSLAGLSRQAAAARLNAAGFSASVTTRPSRQVPKGRVIRTDPPAGRLAFKGGDVLLFISIGFDTVTVTRAVGDNVGEARAGLAAKGLHVRLDPAGAAGNWRVIGQDPRAGTRVAPGSTVTLKAAPPH